MDSLSSKTNVKAIKKAIANLPNTLNQLYDEAFERIDGQNEDDRELAHRALRWVAYAYEPLSVRMLEEALAIDPQANDLDPQASPPITLVLNACAGLLITEEKTATVRLVHYTAQDYFDKLTTSRIHDAHTVLAGDCIAYLNAESIQSSRDGSDWWGVNRIFPLFVYASTFLGLHAKAGREAGLTAEIDAYLLKDPRVWLGSLIHDDALLEECKGCAVAAFFGLCDALRRVLAQTDDVNVLTFAGFSALHLAAHNDQTAAIKVLLEHGADIECKSKRGETPLLTAVLAERRAAYELLVDRGSNVLAMDLDQNMPFTSVKWGSPIPTLQQLLDRGADIDHVPKPKHGMSCLMRQVWQGDVQTVRWLLEKGASVNIRGGSGETALHKASWNGHVDIVDLLLQNGADASISDADGFSPLHIACLQHRVNVTSRLLGHGVDVNQQDRWGKTALHAVAHFSDDDSQCLYLLLAHGADTEKQNKRGETPLLTAVHHDSTHAIDALLKAGADTNKEDACGETALMCAAKYRTKDAVSILLQAGADINKEDKEGKTALIHATESGSNKAIGQLLVAGADVDKQDVGGLTALQHAAGRANLEAIHLLLEHSATPEVRSNSALVVNCSTSRKFKQFATARFEAKDPSGAYYTGYLVISQRFRVINLKTLLNLLKAEHGLPAECHVWSSGMTALDIAVLKGHEECIQVLSNASSASRTDSVSMPLEEYMYSLCGVSTILELEEKWEPWTEEELELRRRLLSDYMRFGNRLQYISS
ncbi:MAG: hypothetical protein LQ344_002427 [Seirophora lacunosa]|nr:MAG: hypothetical protein LQ344_002427 [Seirophora lacunosa]